MKEIYSRQKDQENFERKEAIRQEQAYGQMKRQQYLQAKRQAAMRDSTALLDGQRKEIYQAEKEAEELE